MNITMGPHCNKACIVLESQEDIALFQRIFAKGINCMSDRGKEVEHVADVLLAAVSQKVPA